MLDYESVKLVTQSTPFILAIVAVWVTNLLVLTGVFYANKVSSGKYSKRLISTPAFFWAFFVAFFWNLIALIFLIIYPFWALLG